VAAPAPQAEAVPSQVLARVLEGLPLERHALLCEFVREHVIDVLKLDRDHPPARDSRLMDIGFDSLMAVQLRNRLGRGLGLDKPLPATVMFDHPTIDALAAFLLERMAPSAAAQAPAPAAPSMAAPARLGAEAVAQMSDAEIEALLISRLESR
jgi:hypothetical protein